MGIRHLHLSMFLNDKSKFSWIYKYQVQVIIVFGNRSWISLFENYAIMWWNRTIATTTTKTQETNEQPAKFNAHGLFIC